MSASRTVPLWLVRAASGHPRALVVAPDGHGAREAAGGRRSWTTEAVGFTVVGLDVKLPRVSVEFPVTRVSNGGARGAASPPVVGAGSPVDLLTAAAATFGYTFEQARYSRDPQAVRAKTATWHVMVEFAGWSRSGAARAFGFDHSTVIAALARADDYAATGDVGYLRALEAVHAALRDGPTRAPRVLA